MNKQYMQRKMSFSEPRRGALARSFEPTGKQHPVRIDELILHIYQQLYTYDVAIRKNQKPYNNPYTDSIIYKTNTGKIIQIPTNIQKTAIESWIKKYHKKQLSNIIHPTPKKVIKDEKMNYAPCVFAVIVLVLMYYVGSQGLTK